MHKSIFFSLAAVLFFLVILSMHVQAQPEEILLENDVFVHKKKPPVIFPHSLHMDQFECLDCHHRMQNGENVLDEGDLAEESPGVRCQDCHAKKNFRFSSELDPAQRGLMQAYHKQCISCHRTQGKQSGPRTCNGCHKK
jgi:c(7)-type cytochrome triheme protein